MKYQFDAYKTWLYKLALQGDRRHFSSKRNVTRKRINGTLAGWCLHEKKNGKSCIFCDQRQKKVIFQPDVRQ
jgi:hypothetical protein